MSLVWLVAGGALGTVSRYWLSGAVTRSMTPFFPYGTLAVNVLGCFAAGIFIMSGGGRAFLSEQTRLFFIVGFCGAFTTFSALILDSDQLMRTGYSFAAFGNIVLSVVAGFAAFFAGSWIGSKI